MTESSFNRKDECILCSKLKSISETYKIVKEYALLSEYYNAGNKVYVSILNELRNALDHIMRSNYIKEEDSIKKELEKAEGHLIRAGYDAFEVVDFRCLVACCEVVHFTKTILRTEVFPASVLTRTK